MAAGSAGAAKLIAKAAPKAAKALGIKVADEAIDGAATPLKFGSKQSPQTGY